MSDLIKRQDAIDACMNGKCANIYDCAEAIDNLPSAQPEKVVIASVHFDEEQLKKIVKNELEVCEIVQNWIPCSERLPLDEDYDETFTVTIQCEHHDGWDDYVTGYAEWTPHGWDIQSYYIGQIKVVAWMPLPEPYKGVEE